MSNYKRYFSTSNPVFITFVTYNRSDILIKNIDILRNSFKFTKQKFNFDIIAITILNNHCHMIISTDNQENISKIVRNIKFNFSVNVPAKYCNKNLSKSALKRGEKGIWQRRYYNHIIRNEQDLFRHIDYIHYNSMKHHNISPKNWQYSSFKKFANEKYYDLAWCNFDDKHKINDLDLE